MKTTKLLFILCCVATLAVSVPCQARHNHFHHLMDKYRHRPEVTSISFPPSIFSYMLDKDDQELKSFLRHLHSMSIYTCEAENPESRGDMRTAIARSLNDDDFKDLVIVNDGKDHIEIKMRTEDGVVREAVVVVSDDSSVVVLELEGKIDMKSIVKFTRKVRTSTAG